MESTTAHEMAHVIYAAARLSADASPPADSTDAVAAGASATVAAAIGAVSGAGAGSWSGSS